MKKQGFLLVISMLCMALFTGCSGNADAMPTPTTTTAPAATVPMTTTSPTASTMPSPAGAVGEMVGEVKDSLMPDMNTGMDAGVNTVSDAKRVSDRVEDEVEKLSEVDEAEAVVAGSIALVGISYDTQYQGGLTQRLEDMVKERVEMIDKAITAVHVTDDKDTAAKIKQLQEELDDGKITFEQLQTRVLDIGSSITGGGTPRVNQPQTSTGT